VTAWGGEVVAEGVDKMYDYVVDSYVKGEIDRETLRQMIWTMGASGAEMFFVLEAADQKKKEYDRQKKATT
jgi:hypothetical protein